jgi:pyruvate dehydrogenase E1 component
MVNELKVPDIGDFKNVEIIEVLIKEGDQIKKGDAVITLESDKSSVEVPSSFEGKVLNLKVKIGDKVSKGSLIATISSDNLDNNLKTENSNSILPETEKIIQEAEKILKKSNITKEELKQTPETRVEYKKFTNYSLEQNSIGDLDPLETIEWIESLNSVVERDGPKRANYLLGKLINQAYISGSNLPYNQKTPYINTIPRELEAKSPGDQVLENKIRSLIRWNAACMVVRANKKLPELGGHIATFASAATLYDVGFNHFWKGQNEKNLGDLIYFQGHCARVFMQDLFLKDE